MDLGTIQASAIAYESKTTFTFIFLIVTATGTEGKLAFMASAAEELIKHTGADISPASTLLLDDDVNNVQVVAALLRVFDMI